MSEPTFSQEQTEILRGIWQSIKDLGTNLGGRIDQTNVRLDQTNARLDQTNSCLDHDNARLDGALERLDGLESQSTELRSALVHMEMRLGTELTAVHGELVKLVEHLRAHQADSQRT